MAARSLRNELYVTGARLSQQDVTQYNLNIIPFNIVRQYKTAILVRKIMHNNVPFHASILLKPTGHTRQAEQQNLNLPIVRNVYGRRTIPFVAAKIWNGIPTINKCLPNMMQSLRKLFLSGSYQLCLVCNGSTTSHIGYGSGCFRRNVL